MGELDDPEIAALIEKKAASIGFKVANPQSKYWAYAEIVERLLMATTLIR